MKSHISKGLYSVLILLLLLSLPLVGSAATMREYCQTPPFIGTGGEPNLLVLDDVSGSMGYSAYGNSNSATPPADSLYNASTTYEGYFDPVKNYVFDGISTYRETSGIACTLSCSSWTCKKNAGQCTNAGKFGSGIGANGCSGNRSYGCCTGTMTSGDCSPTSGNYLNFKNMQRIDLIRWALTGGQPATCNTFDSTKCDPELWQSNIGAGLVGTVCNNGLDVNGDGTAEGGCILSLNNGDRVMVRWNRVYDGLAYQLMTMTTKPRMGVMSFSDSAQYIRPNSVYIGDYLTSQASATTSYPYKNFITHVNFTDANGGTPTGPAMWDARNYFTQNTPLYGGLTPMTSTTDEWKNPLYNCTDSGCLLYTCAKNYILLMSDGDWNAPRSTIGSSPSCNATTAATQSADPLVPAYCMHQSFNSTMGTSDTSDDVKTKVNSVYTVGLFMNPGDYGYKAMQNIAMYGAFDNEVKTWPDSLTDFPSTSCNGSTYSGSLCAALPSSSSDWDADANNMPDTFFSAANAYQIKQDIMDAVQDMVSHVTSGTAASVLASGEGSGANLVQATYYPRRRFASASIDWIGGLQNLWYFVDPKFQSSNILEDTDQDRVLDLNDDKRAVFFFDPIDQKAKADLYTGTSTTTTLTYDSTVDFEQLNSIWEAGKLLWNRSAASRTIYTSLSVTSPTLSTFDFTHLASIRPLLNSDDASASAAVNNQLATNIIQFVRGTDPPDFTYTVGASTITETYRSRTASIDLNGNGNATDTGVNVSGVSMDESAKVWKLGDIISSTPRIASWVQLNNYDKAYNDSTYGSGSMTSSGTGSTPFISTATYTTRGMVYVGSNDGMLHAFKLGTLELKWSGQNTSSMMSRLTGTELGKEVWAFIPRNVLPYLKYLKDVDYCHLSTVDLTPVLVDASINKPSGCSASTNYWDCDKKVDSWRTILIGGMRLGGACRDTASTCTNCVKTPVSGNGYSAYFALDVTDQNNPQLLWEFSDPALGFSTSGPAVVKINARTVDGTTSKADINKNGRWFVVFGSGPTGPIDATAQKFMGTSDQNLKLFVLDLKTGVPAKVIDSGIGNAFSGSLYNAGQDSDLDYQDNAVYIPYVSLASASTTTWNDGGVLRLLTNQQLNGTDLSVTGNTALNPSNWLLGTLTSGIGPVTSSVARLQSTIKGELWVYFGTGRYYYKNTAGTDDGNSQRTLFGIKDPCFENASFTNDFGVTIQGKFADACLNSSSSDDPPPVGIGSLTDVTTAITGSLPSGSSGWYINLDSAGTYSYDGTSRIYDAERTITNPLTTTQGNVFFTTYKPYSDTCSIGGKSFLWAVNYADGAAPSAMVGTALIQVSTGSIEQKKLESAFTDNGGRKTGALEGVPPTDQGLSLITQPPGVRRILHMREK
jgi:type IV pilus assembly protein PilY1